MPRASHIAVLLCALLAIPTVSEARARRPAPRAAAKPKAKAKAKAKPRAVAKPRTGAARNARSRQVETRRTTTDRAREKVVNTAPRGKTQLERDLQAKLDAILSEHPALKSAVNGVYVVDMTSGDVLYSFGEDRQLNPASNVKLVATAAALDALGPEWAYETELLGPSPRDGVVKGDVWYGGAGDPTLKHKHFAELAASLRAGGVTRVDGDLIVSSNELMDALPRTTFTVTVVGGAEGELPTVTVSPDSAYFVVETTAISTSKVPASITKGKRRKRRTIVAPKLNVATAMAGDKMKVVVSGKLRPGQRVQVTRNAAKPTLFTAHTLRAYALLEGIEWNGTVRVVDKEVPDTLTVLAMHESAPLDQIAAWVNKPSNNFLADRMIMTVGSELYGGRPSLNKAVQAMQDYLSKIGLNRGTYLLENGSGLSRSNHMSARQIAQVLLAAVKDERIRDEYVASLAVGGVDGTLRGRFRGTPTQGKVFGKTGTLNGVIALSGFVTDDDGHQICFAIMTNGFRNSRKNSVRAAQAKMVDELQAYLFARDASGQVPEVQIVTPEAPATLDPADAPDAPEGADEAPGPEASDPNAPLDAPDEEPEEAGPATKALEEKSPPPAPAPAPAP